MYFHLAPALLSPIVSEADALCALVNMGRIRKYTSILPDYTIIQDTTYINHYLHCNSTKPAVIF